jgi:hypothetical protein
MTEMLDPDWTPERGYSHAQDLLRIIEQGEERRGREAARVAALLDRPASGGRTLREATNSIGRGTGYMLEP